MLPLSPLLVPTSAPLSVAQISMRSAAVSFLPLPHRGLMCRWRCFDSKSALTPRVSTSTTLRAACASPSAQRSCLLPRPSLPLPVSPLSAQLSPQPLTRVSP